LPEIKRVNYTGLEAAADLLEDIKQSV